MFGRRIVGKNTFRALKGEGGTSHGFYNSGGRYYSRDTLGNKTKEYQLWENMKIRCTYMHKIDPSKYAKYADVDVCAEWKYFQVFAEWFFQCSNYREGWQLDKDILGNGKLYSPETCTFVPEEMNKSLTSKKACRGKYPRGVNKPTAKVKLTATFDCKHPEFSVRAYYKLEDVESAFGFVKEAKERYFKFLACKYKGEVDSRVTDFFNCYEVKIDD